MNPEQSIQILESALSQAIANGTYKNIHEANAVLQAFAVISETIKNLKNVEKNTQKS